MPKMIFVEYIPCKNDRYIYNFRIRLIKEGFSSEYIEFLLLYKKMNIYKTVLFQTLIVSNTTVDVERRILVDTRKQSAMVLIILIASVTGLHYFTLTKEWAIHDFYRRLYYVPIIIGAFKYRFRGGIMIAIIISILYLPHVLIYWRYDDIGLINQLLEIVMFLFVSSITGYLVERLYKNNILLSEQLERITEIEILNENIINSISQPLIALNNNYEVKIVNNAAMETYNNLKINCNFLKIENEIFKVIDKPLKKAIDGSSYNYDKIIKIKEKDSYLVKHIKIYSLKNNSNEINGAVIVLEDITEIHHLEEEIRRAEKLSAIGVMASGVAHEIRNPLGIVKTIAQTIRSMGKLPETDIEGLDIIIAEIDRANDVVKEMLEFSKKEKGVLVNSNVSELVKDVIKIMEKFAENKLVDIETCIDDKINCMMDISKMKQVFMNLIMNAIDAMPNGGRVEISGVIVQNKILINVSDEGYGIPKNHLESIFNPFYTTKDIGTGLGLSIAYNIIKEHSGTINVNSKVNGGSEFIIELPYAGGKENEI